MESWHISLGAARKVSLLQDSGKDRDSQLQEYHCLTSAVGKRFKSASRQLASHPPPSKCPKRHGYAQDLAPNAISKITKSFAEIQLLELLGSTGSRIPFPEFCCDGRGSLV